MTIHPTSGTITTVLDVDDGVAFTMDRGTFNVTPGALKPIQADRQRRFGGSEQVGELQDNGTIEWTANARGASSDASLTNLETLFSIIRGGRTDLFFEWRPENATNSTYYEVRGAATITPQYQWVMLAGSKLFKHTVQVPVAPLARGDAYDIALSSTSIPAVFALGSAITGTAPALADITIQSVNFSDFKASWGFFAWTQRPGSPLSSTIVPFGLAEAESQTLTTFASVADASGRGGNVAQVTTSGAGTGSIRTNVDPGQLVADDFSEDVLLEVWARVKLASTVVAPRVVLSYFATGDGTHHHPDGYSLEWGSAGRPLTYIGPSSPHYQMHRLGTVPLPVDKIAPSRWALLLSASWAAGSSGVLGFDYFMFNPVRARALGPTAKRDTLGVYPRFAYGTASTLKHLTLGQDLSGFIAIGSDPYSRVAGLGGSPIELPPGNVDLLVKVGTVPDDPGPATDQDVISIGSVSGNVRVTPRFYLVKGA